MPNYRYRAVNGDGKMIRGIRMARDEQELFEKLKSENQYLVSVREQKPKLALRPLPYGRLADFCRKLGLLLGAGIPLARGYTILLQEENLTRKERAVYSEVLRLICQGVALSDAMDMQGNAFPSLMIFMIRSAEMTGNLDRIMAQLADQYTREHRLNEKIRSSMAYPKFLCGLILVVAVVLVGYVLPQFESLFSMIDPLPLSTRILYGITAGLRRNWAAAALGAGCLALGAKGAARISAVGLLLDRLKLHVPFIGRLLKVIYTARFARTLSSLYRSGLPIVTSMQIARSTVGNRWIDRQFDTAVASVRSGKNLSDSVLPVDGFVKKLAFSIRVGEEAGNLDTMLDSVADALEYEAEEAMVRLTAYLEPMMIIVMAMVIGFIVISVMLPIYESYSAIELMGY